MKPLKVNASSIQVNTFSSLPDPSSDVLIDPNSSNPYPRIHHGLTFATVPLLRFQKSYTKFTRGFARFSLCPSVSSRGCCSHPVELYFEGSHRLSRVLIADQDKDSLERLSAEFEVHGTQLVDLRSNSLSLEDVARHCPDLLILDRNLLGAQAFELCKGVRGDSRLDHLPIVMIGDGDEADRIIALELGADDYVNKPYSYRELVARARALLRRVQFTIGTQRPIEIGELRIDPSSYQVTREGRHVPLTTLEFRLLHFLASQPNRMFSRDQLLEHVWGAKQVVIRRNVDTHISRLRKRIESNPNDPVHLKSLRGVGYMFEIRDN